MPPVDRSHHQHQHTQHTQHHTDEDSSSDADSAHAAGASGGRRSTSKKLVSPLQRGSACLSCRKRKMKCDATKPVCRQCVKANRADECEYDDGRQKSRTQILQEKIAKLEDRIRELEQPGVGATGGASEGFGLGLDDPLIDGMDDGMGGGFGGVGAFSDGLGGATEEGGLLAYNSASASGSNTNTNDLGLAFDTSLFSSGLPNPHAPLSHSPSVSAAGSNHSNGSGSATYSPLALGASLTGGGGPSSLPALPLPSSSAFDGSGAGVGAGLYDTAHPQYPHNSPSSLFFGSTNTPPSTSSSSGRPSLPGALEGRPGSSNSSSRNPSRQNSNRSSWQQPQPGVTADLFASNVNENSLTGSPFPVDISSSYGGGVSGVSGGNGGNGGNFGYGQAQGGHLAHHHRPPSHSQSQLQFHHHQSPLMQFQTGPGLGGAGGIGVGGAGGGAGSRNWWEAKDMAPQNRKMLFDIFLPHARQCGLHVHPGRLAARLGIASPPSNSSNSSSSNSSSNPSSSAVSSTSLSWPAYNAIPGAHAHAPYSYSPPPPLSPHSARYATHSAAHPALANAIWLLGCFFSASASPPPVLSSSSSQSSHSSAHHSSGSLSKSAKSSSNNNGKNNGGGGNASKGRGKAPRVAIPDLSALEDHFLTRTLRGIASALEAGEAEQAALARDPGSFSPALASLPSTSSHLSTSSPNLAHPSSTSNSTANSNSIQGRGEEAILSTSDTLGTPLVDAVQASSLLATYFFAKARLLEGYYHASAAARLAVALGMHQVRSAVWSAPEGRASSTRNSPDLSIPLNPTFPGSGFDSSNSQGLSAGAWSTPTPSSTQTSTQTQTTPPRPSVPLPPPRSSLELHERISAFWQVFNADRCWSVATGLPSSLPEDEHPQLRICCVWPVEGYGEKVTMENADYSSLSALYDVSDNSSHQQEMAKNAKRKPSMFALKSKACAFFERAARVSSLHHDPTQWDQVCAMEFALSRFAATLPGLPQVSSSVSTAVSSSSISHGSGSVSSGSPSPQLGLGLGMPVVQTAGQAIGGGLGDAFGVVQGVQGVDAWGAAFGAGLSMQQDPALMLASMGDLNMDMDMGLGSTGIPASSSSNTNLTTRFTHSPNNSNLASSTSNSSTPIPPDSVDAIDAADPELILIHTLLHVATIQLFHPFAQKDARAHAKCLGAARAVTGVLRRWVLMLPASNSTSNSNLNSNSSSNLSNLGGGHEDEREREAEEREEKSTALVGALDPIMGTCCMCAADVFVREKMLNGSGMSSGMTLGMGAEEMSTGVKPDEEIDTLLCVLRKLGRTFPVAAYQAQKVEQSRNVF
ncbi:hypothetical protein SCHPADRAFT_902493 [Schizopora paradoxa]|uniref:Zn(2)-C6 fungal-type domain-containing protein n=1 Tax=Schizopora paradoxa TaxID=27342 RepID=A0A0H2RUS3_9AGAM|nr:hypothetical protein SCHPADRAFT_902493 [Schizopora paradoxa]